jgi:hypothetical protein
MRGAAKWGRGKLLFLIGFLVLGAGPQSDGPAAIFLKDGGHGGEKIETGERGQCGTRGALDGPTFVLFEGS